MNIPVDSPGGPIRMLANRYQILQVLGSGGFGNTFLAEDTQMPSHRRCVIKQLKPVENDPQVYQLVCERFEREAVILEKLGSENDQIPHLYAYFNEGGRFYLVQELIVGKTLTEVVRQQGALAEQSVWQILINLLRVLEFIHQKQIVHRDIKPDNVILRQEDGKPVLIDFGAVKEVLGTVFDSQRNSQQSIIVGTPGFMSSEQMEGRPTYGSDLYSLGFTAIYLLTEKSPQEFATDPQTGRVAWEMYAPTVRSSLVEVLNRAISIHVQQRFSSAWEMRQSLEAMETLVNSPADTLRQNSFSSPPINGVGPPIQPRVPSHLSPLMSPAPQAYWNSQPLLQDPPSHSMGDWKKAILIGSIMAGVVLIALFLWSQFISKEEQPSSSSPTVSVSTDPEPITESPLSTRDSPEPDLGSSSTPTDTVSPEPIVDPVEDQRVPAVINDPDGYTNIRADRGTESPIVTIVNENEIFYTIPQEDAEWWPVWTSNGEFGYMYYNRIQLRN